MLVDSAKKIVSRLNEIRETSKNEFGLIRNIHPLIHQSFNKKNDKFSHLFISSDIRLVEFDIKRIGFTFGFNYTSSHRINILNSTLNKIYANTIPVYYNVNSVYNQRLVYNFCDSSYLIGIHTDPNFLNITTKFMYNNNIKNNDDFFNFIIWSSIQNNLNIFSNILLQTTEFSDIIDINTVPRIISNKPDFDNLGTPLTHLLEYSKIIESLKSFESQHKWINDTATIDILRKYRSEFEDYNNIFKHINMKDIITSTISNYIRDNGLYYDFSYAKHKSDIAYMDLTLKNFKV